MRTERNFGNAIGTAVLALAILLGASPAPSPSGTTWPAPSVTVKIGTAADARKLLPPSSLQGAATNCDRFVSPGVIVAPDTRPTLFSYRLGADGSVHDATLIWSSGNGELDEAALACANAAHRQEEIVGGAAAEIVWTGAISWSPAGHTFFVPSPKRAAAATCRIDYPAESVGRSEQGDVIVGYRIGMDGAPKDETIVQSSGSHSLDDSALRCVSSFNYFPAYRNGRPVELDKSARIEWRLAGY
jgi:TonB family protein